ncbi:hypothetical protein IKD98_03320 [Candidatus Saccharibacteria bacterium]|nr:hypothetical protein [Candidatus Saccharibacteria bacterium]
MDIVNAVLAEIEEPYGRPTDVIGFASEGRSIANALLPIIGQKEICFFDEKLKSDLTFHYLDFADMLEKTEIMIFTTELPSKYYCQLNKLSRKVKIFIPKGLAKTISVLEEKNYGDNMVLL